MKECHRCLLNENVPGIEFDEKGICSVCNDFDHEWGDWENVKEIRTKQLETMFNDCKRKKRAYDVLVPLSGGKDSTYALYQCAREYGLKCLAVTWDNGFLSDHARENIYKAVDTLGVDHLYYRVDWPLLKKLYKYFFLKAGTFCPVCMRGIGVATSAAAEAFDIPLVVNGTCRRTEEHISPEFFISGKASFFKEVVKGDPIENEAQQFLFEGSKKRKRGYNFFWWTHINRVFTYTIINIPDYIDWDYDVIYNTITNKLGWKSNTKDDEHGDCLATPIVEKMRLTKFPALKSELLRYSKYATIGMMSKEKANKIVNDIQPNENTNELLKRFFDKLDISPEQVQEAYEDPLKHMKFLKEEYGPIFRTLRSIKRAVIPSKKQRK